MAPQSQDPNQRRPAGGQRKAPRNPQTPGRRPGPAGTPRQQERRPVRPEDQRRTAPQRRKPAAGKGYQPRFASPEKAKLSPTAAIVLALVLVSALSLILLGAFLGGREESGTPGSSGGKFEMNLTEAPEGEEPFFQEGDFPEESVPALTEAPLQVVSTARISVTGDLLPHMKVFNKGSAVYLDKQDYNFDPVFQFLTGYSDQADYAVANLETTLRGPDHPYSGNPKFNTPDQIVDAAKKVGFDMLLTANNHCNDTGLDGVLRTVQVIRDKGLTALGSNLNEEEKKYQIVDLNGIRVGMLCYTYEDSQNPNVVTFNYNELPRKASNLVCSFPLFEKAKSREPFYNEVSTLIAEMKDQGADAIVMYLHWGQEYHLEANADQKNMAQTLCDMGVDVIVGGHPHVIEPLELLTSSLDENHKTVCIYSLGNAFSNQRKEEMTSQKSGHTEDGMLFNFTFQKYSDDSVRLSDVEIIPTWVNMHQNDQDKREYNILPLENEKRDQWQQMFGIDAETSQRAAESYDRTIAIVGPGLEQVNAWLAGTDQSQTGESGI